MTCDNDCSKCKDGRKVDSNSNKNHCGWYCELLQHHVSNTAVGAIARCDVFLRKVEA